MFNFDIRFLPGEAAIHIDWLQVHHDLGGSNGEAAHFETVPARPISSVTSQPKTAPQPSARKVAAPLYPIFESEVWELPALNRLLVALDAHYAAGEYKLVAAGAARVRAQQQFEGAERELCEARNEFLDAVHHLNSLRDASFQEEALQNFAALNAMWDLEAGWSNEGRALVTPDFSALSRATKQ